MHANFAHTARRRVLCTVGLRVAGQQFAPSLITSPHSWSVLWASSAVLSRLSWCGSSKRQVAVAAPPPLDPLVSLREPLDELRVWKPFSVVDARLEVANVLERDGPGKGVGVECGDMLCDWTRRRGGGESWALEGTPETGHLGATCGLRLISMLQGH